MNTGIKALLCRSEIDGAVIQQNLGQRNVSFDDSPPALDSREGRHCSSVTSGRSATQGRLKKAMRLVACWRWRGRRRRSLR